MVGISGICGKGISGSSGVSKSSGKSMGGRGRFGSSLSEGLSVVVGRPDGLLLGRVGSGKPWSCFAPPPLE